MNNHNCDLCRQPITGRTTLKGLCGRCSKLLESGKASARIIVSESKAMAERKAVR